MAEMKAIVRGNALGFALGLQRIAAAWLLWLAVPAWAVSDIVLQPLQVGPNTWAVVGEAGVASAANRGFNSNAGFVVTSVGVVVFDALGTPVLGQALIDAVRRVTTQPIRRLIISHYHADHYYGMQAFKAAGVEVWAHEAGGAASSTATRRVRGSSSVAATCSRGSMKTPGSAMPTAGWHSARAARSPSSSAISAFASSMPAAPIRRTT